MVTTGNKGYHGNYGKPGLPDKLLLSIILLSLKNFCEKCFINRLVEEWSSCNCW